MAETHTVYDPFRGKPVTISSRLVDRLRGKYAVGPTLENGEPEFGWVQNKPIAIQVEAAAEIERLQGLLESRGAELILSQNDQANLNGVKERLRWGWEFSRGEVEALVKLVEATYKEARP